MLIQASHLPVLGEDGLFLGFLSKEKLQIEMADLSRESMDWETIPDEFIEKNLPESLLGYFQIYSTLPVLDSSGIKKQSWDKARLLSEYSKKISLEEKANSETDSIKKTDPIPAENPRDPVHWLIRKILESFADPLFATDTQGNSLFFNDRFEKEILEQSFFRNSVQFAERFLNDLNRDVFASFLKANDLDINRAQDHGKLLQTMVPQLGYQVRIVTLSENEKIIGYLYHFMEMKSRITGLGEDGRSFPSVEEAFSHKMPLDLVLQEVESFYIYHSLLENKNNVSHAADALGVPRSTLQNRIKQLELEKKFPQTKDEPIPRKRKKKTSSTPSSHDSRKSIPQKTVRSDSFSPDKNTSQKSPRQKKTGIQVPRKKIKPKKTPIRSSGKPKKAIPKHKSSPSKKTVKKQKKK